MYKLATFFNSQPSFLQRLEGELFTQKQIALWMKRDDRLHEEVSGNKFRKLKYNLLQAKQEAKTQLLTFGGAYSNHLYAVAAVGYYTGFKTIGIVRGDELNAQSNATLRFCEEKGMTLYFVSRALYRDLRNDYALLNAQLSINLNNCYILPEGGSNMLAVKGVSEMVDEIIDNVQPDVIAAAIGTGGTLGGIYANDAYRGKIMGFGSFKSVAFLYQDIEKFTKKNIASRLHINNEFTFGGYGKYNETLIQFIHDFEQQYAIQLEQVYTGKMMYGLLKLIEQDYFLPHTTIVAVHTGGLQGRVK
jgi:1-aminocyclopropane-1-carboxylate deaminase